MSDENTNLGDAFAEGELETIIANLREKFTIKDRTHGFPRKNYPKSFVGREAVSVIVSEGLANSREDAVQLGDMLLNEGVFQHVMKEHSFKDEKLYYRFKEDQDHGETAKDFEGNPVSWADFLAPFSGNPATRSLQPNIPERDPDLANFAADELDACGVEPLDEHNIKLLDNTHPREWIDPEPDGKYNLVVIGAGAGGLVTAAGAAGVGAKVALIESHLLGGDCLNVGCVPSKALISAARVAATARRAGEFGVNTGEVTVDFAKVMERLRKLRANISPVDSADRFSKELGVDVFIGRGKFTGPDTVEVNGKTLKFAKAVVATGGSAAVPPIEGLAEAPYLTNGNIFNLTELPARLGIIGAGPIGMELAQCFQRFGSEVSVFSRRDGILPKEDPEAAKIVEDSMRRDGVNFILNSTYRKIISDGPGNPITVVYEQAGTEHTIEFDAILVATGRKPNVEGMGLEKVEVEYDKRNGIKVDDNLRTTNSRIFAVGDVASKYQFTHMADFMARIVIRNSLFFGRDKFSDLLIPWATYTDPEVAHVGLYEADLKEQEIEYETFTKTFEHLDRAILEGETEGFVKIHVEKGSDKILGATIVGSHAGDMISEISVAIKAGMGLGTLAGVIHPYPTIAEAIRQSGDLYSRTRLTPMVQKIFNRLTALQRA
ncbi:MAG: FAD-containing oxidoreductase [Verrucomicrobiales bacterium]|nr:FAD-containing oxidoreductase [Verrucomicrobiales bacterium]